MEFARRIGDLAHLTRRLSRVQAEKVRSQRIAASARFAAPADVPPQSDEDIGEHCSLAHHRRRGSVATSREAQARAARMQDQLLLRRIPIAVSLVERSWSKLDRKQRVRDERRLRLDKSATLPLATSVSDAAAWTEQPVKDSSPAASANLTSHPNQRSSEEPTQVATLPISSSSPPVSRRQVEAVHLLLQLLHTIERARRLYLRDKLRAAQHRCEAVENTWQSFRRDFASQLRQRRPSATHRSSKHLSAEDEALLRETANVLQQRRRCARDDLALLQSSLLTRPFVSARLWRLLLREPVWTAAVAEHKRAAQSLPVARDGQANVTQLFFLCLALTRIAMGILHDYVNGGQLSRQAPRFVVSLPSWAFRLRQAGSDEDTGAAQQRAAGCTVGGSGTPQTSDNRDDQTVKEQPADADPLFSMLLQHADDTSASTRCLSDESLPAAAAAAAVVHHKRRPGHGRAGMRWIPPHTSDVLPLVIDTLALHSFILPELELTALLQLGCAPELLSLCVTLQHLASTTLTLVQSDQRGSHRSASLHRTLPSLECALTGVGESVVAYLVEECRAPTSSGERTAMTEAGRVRLSPEDAATLAVHLHRLRLLPTRDAGAALLLTQLLTDMFPELRTRTSRVLHEKARQSSLLAFATRPHRQKLYQQHGRKQAEKYVLETVVQQARLQQRQLAAALREQHVTEVHVEALRELGRRLSPSDLVRLFHLYARRTDGGGRSAAAANTSDIWVTGCLYLAETVLLADSDQRGAVFPVQPYSLPELATLWDAATTLLPLLCVRRVRQLAQATAYQQSRASPAAHTESIIWATFAQHVLSGINAALAERLQLLEEQRQHESTAMRHAADKVSQHISASENVAESPSAVQSVTIDSIVVLTAGVLEYASQDEGLRAVGGGFLREGGRDNTHTPSSLQPVQQSVRILSHLLHELILHDRTLWHQVRRLPTAQRDAVERQLRECFHTLGLLDDTTTRALHELHREESVPV